MTKESQNLLAGRVAIVTGASRGIGAAIARRFAAEGAKVVLVARTLDASNHLPGSLNEVAKSIRDAGGKCSTVQADLANSDDLPRIVKMAADEFGTVDILVNNAAWCRFTPITEVASRHMHLAMQMNLYTPHELSQHAYPFMKANGSGWILNISSATADVPSPAPWDFNDRATQYNRDGKATVYGTSKAAMERLTAGWAAELAGTGVAVNALAPVGAVASEGALAVGNFDENDHMESVETMAEAALQLCYRSADELSGRIARSLPLLKELGVETRNLDGSKVK